MFTGTIERIRQERQEQETRTEVYGFMSKMTVLERQYREARRLLREISSEIQSLEEHRPESLPRPPWKSEYRFRV